MTAITYDLLDYVNSQNQTLQVEGNGNYDIYLPMPSSVLAGISEYRAWGLPGIHVGIYYFQPDPQVVNQVTLVVPLPLSEFVLDRLDSGELVVRFGEEAIVVYYQFTSLSDAPHWSIDGISDSTGDYIPRDQLPLHFTPTESSDVRAGYAGPDTLDLLGGNDAANGRDGDDVIAGGAGNDTLLGANGDDLLDGGTGDDVLDGGAGSNGLMPGSGHNVVILDAVAGEADSMLDIQTGADDSTVTDLTVRVANGLSAVYEYADQRSLNLYDGDDGRIVQILNYAAGSRLGSLRIVNGAGAEQVLDFRSGLMVARNGSDGVDDNMLAFGQLAYQSQHIRGLGGNDRIYGSAAGDRLEGGEGNDGLYSQEGRDWLEGGAGADTLSGGDGDDTYLFQGVFGTDRIDNYAVDAESAVDILLFQDLRLVDLNFSRDGYNGRDLLITTPDGTVTAESQFHPSIPRARVDKVVAMDGEITAAAIEWQLDHPNRAPVVTAPASAGYTDTRFDDDFAPVSGQLTATDPDSGTVLRFGIEGGVDLGAGRVGKTGLLGALTLDTATGAYTYTPDDSAMENLSAPAQEEIIFTVSDGALSTQAVWHVLVDSSPSTETAGNDHITGTSQNDRIDALEGADQVDGGAGADYLRGGAGADTLSGGSGNDTFVVSAGDMLVEAGAGGVDLVLADVSWTLGANTENLYLTGESAINGTGTSGANQLVGNAAENYLNGGAGADTLTGGLGNDTYSVESAGDVVVEFADQGMDTVRSTLSYTLGNHLERLILTGSAVAGVGNSLSNQITGNSAANLLDGKGAADTLAGGAGNDTYVLSAGDVVQESAGAGTDDIQAGFSYTLGVNLENLRATGVANASLTGNTLANALVGNSGSNRIAGAGGADTLEGGGGSDTYLVMRGDGQDTVLEGGTAAGADVLWFNDKSVYHDQIWFSRSGNDLLVSLIGTVDSVRIKEWYGSASQSVEQFRAGNGKILMASAVDALVSAMAIVTPPSTGQLSLDAGRHAALDVVLAAGWT